MTIGERIKQIRKENDLTQTQFAKRIKISFGSVSKLERGETNPSDQTVELICRKFGVSERWLLTGEGDPHAQSDTFSLDEFCKARGASELEIKIAKAYFALSDDTRKEILDNFASIFQPDAEREQPLTPEEIEDEVERYRALLKRERALKLALGYGTPPQSLASGNSLDSGGRETGSSGDDIA